MRVIAGSRRSLKLITPEGLDTRPTQDRIKETLFNVIQNDVPGSVFVDLFAGSGGIGIEALSRGAKRAYLVDQSKLCEKCIQTNLRTTRFTEEAVYLKQDVFFALSSTIREHADIIYMDPPYHMEYEKQVLSVLSRNNKIADEETLIIVEASLDTDFSYLDSMGYDVIKEKTYKTNKHIFIRKRGNV